MIANRIDARKRDWHAATAMARKSRSTDRSDTDLAALTDEVRKLKEELRVLGDILTEIREDFQWAVQNGKLPAPPLPPMTRITSLPLDPAAADFGERINAVAAEHVEALRSSYGASVDEPTNDGDESERHQRDLF